MFIGKYNHGFDGLERTKKDCFTPTKNLSDGNKNQLIRFVPKIHQSVGLINNKKTVTFPFLLSSHPKTTTMQTKKWISVGFLAAILLAGILMLSASTPKAEKATCCKKDPKECSGDKKLGIPAETTLENLSHQFISLPVFLH